MTQRKPVVEAQQSYGDHHWCVLQGYVHRGQVARGPERLRQQRNRARRRWSERQRAKRAASE